jgi:hypothetical protein
LVEEACVVCGGRWRSKCNVAWDFLVNVRTHIIFDEIPFVRIDILPRKSLGLRPIGGFDGDWPETVTPGEAGRDDAKEDEETAGNG